MYFVVLHTHTHTRQVDFVSVQNSFALNKLFYDFLKMLLNNSLVAGQNILFDRIGTSIRRVFTHYFNSVAGRLIWQDTHIVQRR